MQSVSSNAVALQVNAINTALSGKVNLISSFGHQAYYTNPITILKSILSPQNTYLITLVGTYASVYSGAFIFFYGGANDYSYTIFKSICVGDITSNATSITIPFIQASGIGQDWAQVEIIKL